VPRLHDEIRAVGLQDGDLQVLVDTAVRLRLTRVLIVPVKV
jgi:hypothetical protein